ncbi:hypothetical protein M3182_00940 [Mesobacillus maritimus]|uniref:hypothetical protein n=1 Tax=Mesobacillus maritimus TaxID=1643336 RepID=UPI00203F0474|nr:hypothetical protein [Mesobacillus maritimus]MCM3584306.1 hypothetical protein [Mesobacillus maritimus]MCM3669277.1 hypothetical protein [Mesobacillus maritimus]
MATIPHIEDSTLTTYISPQGEFETFTDDNHFFEKLKEWGLSTAKKKFWYKEKEHQRLVSIKGFQVYGETDDYNTIIIEFEDGNLSCIHPAFLKEMQAASFGKNLLTNHTSPATQVKQPTDQAKAENEKKSTVSTSKTEKKTTKEKASKLELPTEKVHFTAKVKQFGLTWNHFNEDNDEVVVFEEVVIQQEQPLEIGFAWCAHSKTLKKQELLPGETLEFDGKIVKKKLPKGKDIEDEEMIVQEPVQYKLNNPSKIKKV